MSVAWILFDIMECLFLSAIALVLLICVGCLVIATPFIFNYVKQNMQKWLEDL